MKKKRILIITLITLILAGIGMGVYYYFTKQDENTTLTVLEKQWIEDNKNNIIDLSIVGSIPVFNYDGEGLIFDFISSMEDTTGLEYNKLFYNYGEKPTSDYGFLLVDKVEKNDILVYEDNFAILTKDSKKYSKLSEVPSMTLGVLAADLDRISYYLQDRSDFKLVSYETENDLFNGLGVTVDGIILEKTVYLKNVVENDKINIAYNITDMVKSLVIRLGDNKKLNNIIKKYYSKWSKDNYTDVYNQYFSDNYFEFKEIYEQKKVKFRSKRYKYAFINNVPFDKLVDGTLTGINKELIKGFASLADIEVEYDEYSNYSSLISDFNAGKIDFFFNDSSNVKFDSDYIVTVSPYSEEIVVLAKVGIDANINSLASLSDYTVKTIKGSLVEQSFKTYKIETESYSKLSGLTKNNSKDDVIVINKLTYDTYMHNTFKNYKVAYTYNLSSDYNFITLDNSNNEVFDDYFNFYLSFINGNEYINKVKASDFEVVVSSKFKMLLVLTLIVIILFIVVKKLRKVLKPDKNKSNISKEDKLRYIDMLTSLKNRNYLNDYIEDWDSTEIYPQAIIIADLNNIAYINDNYGHEEGDKVIKEAANILITTQMENSEIIRTNGNEFLIYLVEYDEKQVLTYIRKLNKEFKEISHGFGVAIGYSIVNDGLKTLDDAINEATLDMRSVKEESQN